MPTHPETGHWYQRYCDCRACIQAQEGSVDLDYDHEDETYDEDYCGDCACSPCECRTHVFGDAERCLLPMDRNRMPTPLLSILRKGGRYWSAEVEINGLTPESAAKVAEIPMEGYGAKSKADAYICATSDCTVDAEIKIGRIRDGGKLPAEMARMTYDALRLGGGVCNYNAGHHVHVDATRVCDLGVEAVRTVLRASLTLANACEPALMALAASGYEYHRAGENDYAGSLKDPPEHAERGRTAWHASNARSCAHYGVDNGGGIPTFEYRLPNGTTEPIRAHAHIAIALGLLDLGERFLDRDQDARDFVRKAEGRIASHMGYSEADAAGILARALHLSPDSLTALAIAADTAPASKQHRDIWKIAAAA